MNLPRMFGLDAIPRGIVAVVEGVLSEDDVRVREGFEPLSVERVAAIFGLPVSIIQGHKAPAWAVIKRLRAHGWRVYATHERVYEDVSVASGVRLAPTFLARHVYRSLKPKVRAMLRLSQYGGRTTVRLERVVDGDATKCLGVAVCHPREQFNRRIGLRVALERALDAAGEPWDAPSKSDANISGGGHAQIVGIQEEHRRSIIDGLSFGIEDAILNGPPREQKGWVITDEVHRHEHSGDECRRLLGLIKANIDRTFALGLQPVGVVLDSRDHRVIEEGTSPLLSALYGLPVFIGPSEYHYRGPSLIIAPEAGR